MRAAPHAVPGPCAAREGARQSLVPPPGRAKPQARWTNGQGVPVRSGAARFRAAGAQKKAGSSRGRINEPANRKSHHTGGLHKVLGTAGRRNWSPKLS